MTGAVPLLRAGEISVTRADRQVLNQVSLEVAAGEVVGLLGANGAGKTTLLRVLMGLQEAPGSRIWLAGEEISWRPTYWRARQGMGYLPQEASAFLGLRVEENVRAVLELRGLPRERAAEALQRFGLSPLRRQLASTLSGGEKRRLELCRLWAWHPRLLLLDEPFRELDQRASQQLEQIIQELAAAGCGVLFTDHLLPRAGALCSRCSVLDDGRIATSGAPQDSVTFAGRGSRAASCPDQPNA